jgi:hypothetical protein
MVMDMVAMDTILIMDQDITTAMAQTMVGVEVCIVPGTVRTMEIILAMAQALDMAQVCMADIIVQQLS